MLSPKATMAAAVGGGPDVDGFQEVPGGDVFGVGRERLRADDVAGGDVVGLVGRAVDGEVRDLLCGEEEADGEVGEGGRASMRDGVARRRGAGGDDDRAGLPPKVRALAAGSAMSPLRAGERDVRGADGQGLGAELVREFDAHERAADRDVDDLAEGGVGGGEGGGASAGVLGRVGRSRSAVAQVPTQWSGGGAAQAARGRVRGRRRAAGGGGSSWESSPHHHPPDMRGSASGGWIVRSAAGNTRRITSAEPTRFC